MLITASLLFTVSDERLRERSYRVYVPVDRLAGAVLAMRDQRKVRTEHDLIDFCMQHDAEIEA